MVFIVKKYLKYQHWSLLTGGSSKSLSAMVLWHFQWMFDSVYPNLSGVYTLMILTIHVKRIFHCIKLPNKTVPRNYVKANLQMCPYKSLCYWITVSSIELSPCLVVWGIIQNLDGFAKVGMKNALFDGQGILLVIMKMVSYGAICFYRPGVAGALLQSPLLLINWVSDPSRWRVCYQQGLPRLVLTDSV